jgi:hypothetical protein
MLDYKERLDHANQVLARFVKELGMAQTAQARILPEDLSAMFTELLQVGAMLRDGTLHKDDPAVSDAVRQYRTHLEQLRDRMPELHARLLTERARLEAQRSHLEAANAWAEASHSAR